MLLTHGILSAYLLSAFVVTATPIPTPPHLLPRIAPNLSPDSLLTRGLDEARDIYEGPEEEHTSGKLDIRMADAGMFNFDSTVATIALNLDNIDAEDIPKVASDLSRKRIIVKKHVRLWPSAESDWAKVVEGVRDWENALRKWKDPNLPQQSTTMMQDYEEYFSGAKWKAEDTMRAIMGVDFQAEFAKNSIICGVLAERCKALASQVLEMSIDDTRDLHTKLGQAVAHVQNNWMLRWPKLRDEHRESIEVYLGVLNNDIMVFGSTASITATTTPSKTVVTK
ncbi:hypothetical protein H0H93_004661 [Arthromyces matolae]|nr:hypothetical protein H0H93_004661 [Arthromyces matolae]